MDVVAERRHWTPSSYEHMAATQLSTDARMVRLAAASYMGEHLRRADEILNKAQAIDVLVSFLDRVYPESVAWRDMTAEMLAADAEHA